MHIEEIKIKTNADDVATSFERLTAAINAASAALDSLGDRRANISIAIAGSIARVEIEGCQPAEGIDVDPVELVRRAISTIDRDG